MQGVGFRWWTRAKARSAGLSGCVWNCDDGSVRVDVSGPPSRSMTSRPRFSRAHRPPSFAASRLCRPSGPPTKATSRSSHFGGASDGAEVRRHRGRWWPCRDRGGGRCRPSWCQHRPDHARPWSDRSDELQPGHRWCGQGDGGKGGGRPGRCDGPGDGCLPNPVPHVEPLEGAGRLGSESPVRSLYVSGSLCGRCWMVWSTWTFSRSW